MTTFSLITSILSLQLFFFSSFVVEGPSMEPTLHDGHVFLTERLWEQSEQYERGDVVVFSFEDDPDYFYVKRVVGLPGEKVTIRSNGVYVDDVHLTEPYLVVNMSSVPGVARYRSDFEQTYNVPEDAYFVLGDNREQSLDSRHFADPFVKSERIEGRRVFDVLADEGPEGWSTVLIDTDDGTVPFTVEVAETQEQQMTGLMYREHLPKGHGMYFIFGEEVWRSFWMKNTLIPLDMIFIDSDGVIVHIVKNAQPCQRERCLTYPSKVPAKYVLEIGGGESTALGIDVGDTVEFIRNL